MVNFGNSPQPGIVTAFQRSVEANKAEGADNAEQNVALAETKDDTIKFAQQTLVPRNADSVRRPLKERPGHVRINRKGDAEMGDKGKMKPEKVKDLAKQFSQQHDELNQDHLEEILRQINNNSSKEDVRDVVISKYPDPYLANLVFEFLSQSTDPGKVEVPSLTLHNTINSAHDDYAEDFHRDIQIGQNITQDAKTFTDLDSPAKLREWYRTLILSTPGELKTSDLFLKMKARFGHEKMVKATNFFLVALGADLRGIGKTQGGNDMSRIELTSKVSEVRKLQAIVNIYRCSSMAMRIIPHALNYYEKLGFHDQLPPDFNYQKLAEGLVTILGNRHLNKDIILQTVRDLGFR